MLSISDIMNDTESYRNSFEQMAGIINKIDSRYNYYYDIVDNYDFYERPDEIDELDGIVNKLENLKYDFEDLKNIFEEFLNGAKHLSNIQLPQKQNTINIG
jgi:exonuclease VII small subunit